MSTVAIILGCNRTTIKRMLEDGRLEGFRIGKLFFVYIKSIKKYQQMKSFDADGIE